MKAVDPLCGGCGHVRGIHDAGSGRCHAPHDGSDVADQEPCKCDGFVPATNRARADAEAFLARIAKLPHGALESGWFRISVDVAELHRVCTRLVEIDESVAERAA